MSNTRDKRVNEALSRLVNHTLPSDPQEDEEVSDQRFYGALDAARGIIDTEHAVPAVLQDVDHVSDLIKRNLVRQYDTPDNALKFGHLFNRLLSLPVLSQRWAILYLLHQLSGSGESEGSEPRSQWKTNQTSNDSAVQPISQASPRSSGPQQRSQAQRESVILDEALSRPGLSSLRSSHDARESLSQQSHVPRPRNQQVLNGTSKVADSPKAARLFHSDFSPSESSLLRDLPFTLQGVSSTNMTFPSSASIKFPQNIPVPLVSLLHALAEPALLYKGLSRFVDASEGGLIGQSFRAAISIELRSYLGLVATLEGQIRTAISSLEDPQQTRGVAKAGVTLKRCVIWTRDATMGLRLMSLIVDESKTRKGGQFISLIHSFASSHGDPFVGAFAEKLLSHVTRPFYDMLRSWIYDGELCDPYMEFFVSEQPELLDDAGGKGGATSVWEDKYKLDENMIPSIMAEEFARKVFLIGKSLNFIRHGCGDAAWVEDYSRDTSRELRYGDTATLEASIDEAYKTTMVRLTHLMNDKFKLKEHLVALKRYLLLGQGDFVALLMESLSSNLDRPANSQYRHTLTAQLEHAIRNSNAQHDSPEVLRRLDARMLELSHGEIGWDVFTLEYKIDAPVDVVVTPYGSKQYLKVFNFLWRVKRVEFALGSAWRRCMTGARGVLGSVADKVGKDWKTVRCAIAEMIHFVDQLQYYILFEVIEASWDQLQATMSRSDCTLDDLIQAHAKYLKSITRKGLLGSSNLDFTSQLHELLKIMLAYKDAVDGLYSYSVTEFTRRQDRSARIESRTAQGSWGITDRDDDDLNNFGVSQGRDDQTRGDASPLPPPLLAIGLQGASNDTSVLTALRSRLNELAVDFRARVCGLLGDLAYQPDTDMRFLGVVMNFNDNYKVVRKSRRKPGDVDKRKERTKEGDGANGALSTASSQRNVNALHEANPISRR